MWGWDHLSGLFENLGHMKSGVVRNRDLSTLSAWGGVNSTLLTHYEIPRLLARMENFAVFWNAELQNIEGTRLLLRLSDLRYWGNGPLGNDNSVWILPQLSGTILASITQPLLAVWIAFFIAEWILNYHFAEIPYDDS